MLKYKKLLITMVLVAFLLVISMQQQLAKNMQDNKVKMLIPLYAYPSWYQPEKYIWPDIANAASQVSIAAIINPNNGPEKSYPNRDYSKGLQELEKAGVTIFGYVFTKYGNRPINEVKADIDLYDKYYKIHGIFLDEAASNSQQIDYYREIYQYIKTKANLKTVVLNQGTHTDEGYLMQQATDITVIFENYSKFWPEYTPSSYLTKYPADRFSGLIHSVPDVATMKKHIDMAVNRNIGYIYVTDDSPDNPDKNPWNNLPSYWQQEIDYLKSLNLSDGKASRPGK